MIRISKEKIGGNIHISDDAPDINEGEDIGHICCDGDDCQLPEWAADDH